MKRFIDGPISAVRPLLLTDNLRGKVGNVLFHSQNDVISYRIWNNVIPTTFHLKLSVTEDGLTAEIGLTINTLFTLHFI